MSYQLVLLAFGAATVSVGAIIAAWRMIPRLAGTTTPHARLNEIEEAVEAIRLAQLELADRYELTVKRNATRVGRLRSKVAKLQDEDYEEDDDAGDDAGQAPAVPVSSLPDPPVPQTKAEMWAQYNAAINQRQVGS